MDDFFRIISLEKALEYRALFESTGRETVPLGESFQRILAEDIHADTDLPDFGRSTMDGFAVMASSTFGASMGSPAWLTVKGTVAMGQTPEFSIGPGEAARIATGGMLPPGADSVVMIEYADSVDDRTIEVYRSVAPGVNIVEKGEDFERGTRLLTEGTVIRPQEAGLMAAFGVSTVEVYRRPVVGIVSTGDEVVPVTMTPTPGQVRDINTYTLQGKVMEAGGVPVVYGIVNDNAAELFSVCEKALSETDMVLLSGGSSVGVRDYTLDVFRRLPDASVLFHGIAISPGKPVLLANASGRAVWGIPGHVVSAMVVFDVLVKPFIQSVAGRRGSDGKPFGIAAILTRNVPSAQGRAEIVRVRLIWDGENILAEPLLGKSGLINTMVHADGVFRIPVNMEGMEKGSRVTVTPV